jgi:hemerythrin
MAILFRHTAPIDQGEDLAMESLRPKAAKKTAVEMPPPVFWSELYTCGNALLDAQHRSLMGKGNELMEAAQRGEEPEQLAILFDELTQQMLDHFIAEEALLAKAKHPLFAEHQAIHRDLLSRATQTRTQFEAGAASITALLRFAVHDMLARHIVADDQRFLETVSAHH